MAKHSKFSKWQLSLLSLLHSSIPRPETPTSSQSTHWFQLPVANAPAFSLLHSANTTCPLLKLRNFPKGTFSCVSLQFTCAAGDNKILSRGDKGSAGWHLKLENLHCSCRWTHLPRERFPRGQEYINLLPLTVLQPF